MADVLPQFDTQDNIGSSVAFSGTATTTPASVPGAPDKVISGFMFSFAGANIEISTDGGTSYFEFPKNAYGYRDVKGSPTQILIRTTTGTTGYKLWIDFEDY